MTLPSKVRILDVGPRDGLQNEATLLTAGIKVELIRRLVAAGLQHVEATAFVSPRWVPQMGDAAQVMAQLADLTHVHLPVLVPNLQGLEAALAAGAREVAVFAAASETFSRKNTNCTIVEAMERFVPVLAKAHAAGVAVRGYLSCVVGCPFEGAVKPQLVADLAWQLFDMGCSEISLADTIGVGTPNKVKAVIDLTAKRVPLKKINGHFHDTYGTALVNVYAALEMGVSSFDSAIAGLGGCPYAPGASGNLATEDLVYLLQGLGIETGLDLVKLCETGDWISAQLGRPNVSRVSRASHAAQALQKGANDGI